MQYQFFIIPIKNTSAAVEELNHFLRENRILSVKKEFVSQEENSFWTLAVEYIDENFSSGKQNEKKSRVDYKEMLSESDFVIFSKLRELRKELATAEGIQLYTIFTNEQLAEMVTRKISTIPELGRIDGIGESKISKYADRGWRISILILLTGM